MSRPKGPLSIESDFGEIGNDGSRRSDEGSEGVMRN